jgi:hypothetical protein
MAFVLVDAPDHLGHPGRFLIEARAPGSPARDHGDIEIQHREIIAEQVAARTDLRVHHPPAIGPALGSAREDHGLVRLVGGEPTRIVAHPDQAVDLRGDEGHPAQKGRPARIIDRRR